MCGEGEAQEARIREICGSAACDSLARQKQYCALGAAIFDSPKANRTEKTVDFRQRFFFGAPGGIQAETARGSAPPFLFRRQNAGGDFAVRNHKKRLPVAAFFYRTVRIPASQNKKPPGWVVFRFGAPGGIRTCDLPVRSRALYPLSYKRIQSVFRLIYISTTLLICQQLFKKFCPPI